MVADSIKAVGHLFIDITDSEGNLIESHEHDNLVVTVGKQWIAGRLKDTGGGHTIPVQMSHMSVGENTHAGWPDDPSSLALTALKDSPELARVALTSTTVSTNEVTYVATFGAGQGTGAIVEAGIFNNVSGGTMLCRTEFAVVNKGANDTMTITWKVSLV